MKITYNYRGWYVFYYNSKYVAQNNNGVEIQADNEDALLNNNGVEIQADNEDALLNNIDAI